MKTEIIVFLPGMDHGWVVDEKTFQNFIDENEIDNVSGVHDNPISFKCQINEILLDMLKE